MILEQKTLNDPKMGKLPSELTYGANKNLWISCDYCNIEFIANNKNRNVSKRNYIVQKDCCIKCRQLKKNEEGHAKGIHEERERISHEKGKKTLLEKYGVDHNSKIPEVIEGKKQKWDIKSLEEKENIKNKRRDTNLKFHGVEHFFNSPDFREKAREGCLEKFGFAHPMKSQEIKKKVMKTMMENHGVLYAAQSPEVQKKMKKSQIEKYGDYYINTEAGKRAVREAQIKSGNYLSIGGFTAMDWTREYGINNTTISKYFHKHGEAATLEYIRNYDGHGTAIENIIEKFLKDNNFKFKKRKKIGNRFYDFLINDSLIIECDGLYWHSEWGGCDKRYHQYKKSLYAQHGYKSLFFREHEIFKNIDIIKSIILSNLNIYEKEIDVSECKLEKIEEFVANQWFLKNHLGYSNKNTTFIGLKYNNEIISILEYKELENFIRIYRHCNILNTKIQNSFNFLISQFENKKLVIFLDIKYEDSEKLKDFESQGQFIKCEYTNFGKDKTLAPISSNPIFIKNVKIWDCGQEKWIKNLKK